MSHVTNALLAIIAVVALIGNAMTVVLFIKKYKWLKKACNCLVLALSIQDILVAICLLVIPSFVLDEDIYPLPSKATERVIFCSLVWSHYFPFALGVTSVYTCLMLTIDRWMAVVKPLYYKRYMYSAKVISAMVIIPWIAGFCFELSSPFNAAPTKWKGSFSCTWKKVESSTRRVLSATIPLLGMLIIPTILMIAAYIQIVLHLKRAKTRVNVFDYANQPWRNISQYKVLKRVTVMAFAASTIVVVCWLPDQVYYSLSQVELTELGTSAHSMVKVLAFANSCLNPFIYSFSNKSYRKGFKEILFFACLKKESDEALSLGKYS